MTYSIAFPDFGPMDVAIPAGFDDTSWKNDACPSFIGFGLKIWVDYADAAKREMENLTRFAVVKVDEEGCDIEYVLQSDDWNEVLACIKTHTEA